LQRAQQQVTVRGVDSTDKVVTTETGDDVVDPGEPGDPAGGRVDVRRHAYADPGELTGAQRARVDDAAHMDHAGAHQPYGACTGGRLGQADDLGQAGVGGAAVLGQLAQQPPVDLIEGHVGQLGDDRVRVLDHGVHAEDLHAAYA